MLTVSTSPVYLVIGVEAVRRGKAGGFVILRKQDLYLYTLSRYSTYI